MKRGPTFIRARNPECSTAASTFTQQTAACIAILNKSVPTTSPTTSSANGAIAAARRAITFLIVRCFWEKCEWARTSQALERARPRPKNPRRRSEPAVLRLKELQPRRLLHKQLHLRPAARRQQHSRDRPGVRLQRRRLRRQ